MSITDVVLRPQQATAVSVSSAARPEPAYAGFDTFIVDAPTLAPELADVSPNVFLECVELADVPQAPWARLAERAIEPNAFYDPAWARTVSAHARGHQGAKALLVWDDADRETLIGFLPVRWAWAALKLPLRMLVAWQAYARVTTPLLDRDAAERAAGGLVDAAAAAGARALLLPDLATAGPAANALRHAFASRDLAPRILRQNERAWLDASGDGKAKLYAALGSKKLKELRRQRHRLSDHGAISFEVASSTAAVAAALEQFLALEMDGWKGRAGTALAAHPGDARFIREAAAALAAQGRFDVVTLARGGVPAAAGLVLRQGRRAYFFKIAIDESLARTSPGVQITLDLTQHFCAHAGIDGVD